MAAKEPGKAANIFDVARLAGVSHQTVSRVLNGATNVRPATQERVEQAMAQLRYSPSPAARALVTRRTRTIGLITPAAVDYGPASIAMHFNIAARAARYSVDTVSAVEGDPAAVRASVESLLRQRVDALCVVVSHVAVLDLVRSLEVAVPLVAAASAPQRSSRLVSIDQYRGARSATQHLIDQGHERVLHVAGPEWAADAVERVRGWRDELVKQQREVVAPIHGEWTAESGYRIGLDLDVTQSDAVFVGNDQMAIGLVSALRRRGFTVPDDISVVGFDDIPEAGYLDPPLTTVRQDFDALGRMLMQKLLVSLEEAQAETTDTPLPTSLVVRESTRPVEPRVAKMA